MKNKLFSLMTFVFILVLSFTTISASAQSPVENKKTTEVVLEDTRTLTPKGNAKLMDDVTDNENLQFITVTARDDNVFYFIIDHGAETENVYFLNTVDEADLNALIEENSSEKTNQQTSTAETPIEEPEVSKEPESSDTEKGKSENNMLFPIILIIVAAVGVGGYYYKVILPKKKLEEADDIEDFEFDEDNEETSEELTDDDVDDAEEVYGEDTSEEEQF